MAGHAAGGPALGPPGASSGQRRKDRQGSRKKKEGIGISLFSLSLVPAVPALSPPCPRSLGTPSDRLEPNSHACSRPIGPGCPRCPRRFRASPPDFVFGRSVAAPVGWRRRCLAGRRDARPWAPGCLSWYLPPPHQREGGSPPPPPAARAMRCIRSGLSGEMQRRKRSAWPSRTGRMARLARPAYRPAPQRLCGCFTWRPPPHHQRESGSPAPPHGEGWGGAPGLARTITPSGGRSPGMAGGPSSRAVALVFANRWCCCRDVPQRDHVCALAQFVQVVGPRLHHLAPLVDELGPVVGTA
jgi:hypothetical protein